MRFALVHLTLLAAVSAAAASLVARQATLPTCAVPCLSDTNSTTCTPNDDTCLCNDKTFINTTTTCIESACSGSDLQAAESFAQQLCLAVGVTLTASSAAPTSTASSASASAASPSSTTSSSSGTSVTSSINVFTGAVVALAIAAVL